MARAEFVREASDLLFGAHRRLWTGDPDRLLVVVQEAIEDLTALVEEYEGVLDGDK